MLRLLSRATIPALALALLTLAGCGPSGTSVTGDVTYGSEKMIEGDKIVITLEADGRNYSTDADAAGKFTIVNVLPGTYKVRVIHYSAATTPGEGKGKAAIPGAAGPPGSGKGSPVGKGPPPGVQGSGSPEGPSMAGPNAPKIYPEEWTVPGGPFKLDMSKLKK